jgi:hypothetical protein
MGAIRLSLVRMSQRISMGTDQMCCRHFHWYTTLLFTGKWAPSHPPRNPFSVTGSIMSACCKANISRSNLWNSAVSTRLHRTVWPAVAQIRTKLTNNWGTLSIYIPFTIRPSAGSSLCCVTVFWTAFLPLIICYASRDVLPSHLVLLQRTYHISFSHYPALYFLLFLLRLVRFFFIEFNVQIRRNWAIRK